MKIIRNVLVSIILVIPIGEGMIKLFGLMGILFHELPSKPLYDMLYPLLFLLVAVVLRIALSVIAFYYVIVKNYRWAVWLAFAIAMYMCIPYAIMPTDVGFIYIIFWGIELISSIMLLHVDTTFRKRMKRT